MTTARRTLLKGVAALGALQTVSMTALAQAPSIHKPFAPVPGRWRTFEVTTRVDVASIEGQTRVWVPVPSIESNWQQSLDTRWLSNGSSQIMGDGVSGFKMVYASFNQKTSNPFVEVTSIVKTQDRDTDLKIKKKSAAIESTDTLNYYQRATHLLPIDGIVKSTAQKAIGNAKTDLEKTKAIYQWVVSNAWREPKVRGCGEGDIKTMLETGNLGGKCADINALFVGLCRSVGIPARDVYGLRLAPSAFGYKELSGNSTNLKGAQHCRAEVYLQAQGWVAMDPADVAKVMRLETNEWIKNTAHPVVQPVFNGLMGGWEGNWLAWNTAHDVKLPQSKEGALGFFMYPIAENEQGRFDSYAPDSFKYQITAREI